MSNYDTGKEILQDVLAGADESTELSGPGVSEYLAEAKLLVMRAYWDVLSWAAWPWAVKYPPGVFQTVDKVTGTAAVTKGSASVLMGAVVASSMAGRKFFVDSQGVMYRISAHTAGTDTLTLDVPYTEADGSDVAFTIFQDEYQVVTGANGPIKIFSFAGRGRNIPRIEFISKELMDSRPYLVRPGTWIHEIALIASDRVKIRPWPEEAKTIEYEYVERPSTLTFDAAPATDTPTVPIDDRVVIADLACGLLHERKGRTDDFATKLNLGLGKINRMLDKWIPQKRQRVTVRPSQALGRRT